jgi:hypothetical protein
MESAVSDNENPAPSQHLRALLEEALSTLDTYSDPTSYNDGMGEMLEADTKDHPGLLAQATAAKIRAALTTEGQPGPKEHATDCEQRYHSCTCGYEKHLEKIAVEICR